MVRFWDFKLSSAPPLLSLVVISLGRAVMHDCSDVVYRLEDIRDDRIERVRRAVEKTFVNGGMLVACVVPTLAEDYVAAGPDEDRIRRFLACPAIPKLIPELQPISPIPESLRICLLGPYAFEGEIVQLLLADGCYRASAMTIDTARPAAADFVEAIAGTGRSEFRAHRIEGHWAEWFEGIELHAVSYVVPRPRQYWLICAYDTD